MYQIAATLKLKPLLNFILILSIVFNPIALSASSKNLGIINPDSLVNVDPDLYSQYPENLTQEETNEVKKFLDLPTQNVLEILYLLRNHYHKVQREEQSLGFDKFIKKIQKRQNSDSIEFEIEGVGKAEPLLFTHENKAMLFTKVRHNGLKRIFFFVDREQFNLSVLEQKPDITFSKKMYEERLRDSLVISRYFRVLIARMLLQDWNSALYYEPLPDMLKELEASQNNADQDLSKKVEKILNEEAEVLEKLPWFKAVQKRAIDMIVQIENHDYEKGWDVQVVFYSSQENKILNNQNFVKPKIFQVQGSAVNTVKQATINAYARWKLYWANIWEPPAYNEELWKKSKWYDKPKVVLTGDYLMGLGFGVALGALSYGTALAVPGSVPDGLSAQNVALISFSYSLFFGVFSKTWQRFIYKGTDLPRFFKNWLSGLMQSYHFQFLSDHNLLPILDGELDFEALKIHSDILVNQSIKSLSKNGLQEKPKFRADRGEAQGTLKMYWPQVNFPVIRIPWKHNLSWIEFDYVEKDFGLSDIASPQFDLADKNSLAVLNSSEVLNPETRLFKYRDIVFRFPWIEKDKPLVTLEPIDTKIPRKNWEGQTVQFWTTPVGLLSRFGWAPFGLPIGHMLYGALGPIGSYRALLYKEHYLEMITEKLGAQHPEVKRVRDHVVKARKEWNNLNVEEIKKWKWVEYILGKMQNVVDSSSATQFLYKHVIQTLARSVGFYIKPISHEVVIASQKIAAWTYVKLNYQFANFVKKQLSDVDASYREAVFATRKMELMSVVRNQDGAIHPEQVRQALLRQERNNACSLLFR